MNLNNFTIQASEVIQSAQQLAFNASHSQIESEHIMLALLDQKNSPVEYLLKKSSKWLNMEKKKHKNGGKKIYNKL